MAPRDAKELCSMLTRRFLNNFQGCHKTCFQHHVVSECSCGDPKLPLDGRSIISGNTEKVQPCPPDKGDNGSGRSNVEPFPEKK